MFTKVGQYNTVQYRKKESEKEREIKKYIQGDSKYIENRRLIKSTV